MEPIRVVSKIKSILLILVFCGLAAGGALTSTATPSGIIPYGDQLHFLIWRKGDDIGRHDVRFHREADKLIVEVSADIRVSVLLFTIYSFKQRVREEWANGRLMRFTSRTVESGQRYTVDGQATESGFRVTGSGGTHMAQPGIIPATYWHPDTAHQKRLMNIKTGEILNVQVREGSIESVRTPVGSVLTKRYEMRGDVHMTLWYDQKRRLAQVWYRTPLDGSIVEYRRRHDAGEERAETP